MKTNRGVEQVRAQSRRDFLKQSGVVAAAVTLGATATRVTPVYGQTQAPSPGRVIGANDRIQVGVIGTGGQGTNHIKTLGQHGGESGVKVAAICDLFEKRRNQARAAAGLEEKDAYLDHRKLLERKDLDAVVVATVDNWHADVAIDALEAGKHVYGEKPMARYLEEGFRVYDTVKRTGKVFQIGSQYCSDPKYHQVAKWIRNGKLGPLVWAQGSYCRNHPRNSEWTYPVDPDANAKNLDWDRWLGRAPKISFTPEHYFSWHKYYAYNSGILGNLLSHTFLPLLMATGLNEFPRRVVCTGTRKVSTDREINDTTHLLAEMPGGLTFCVVGSTVNEQGLPEVIRGRKSTVYLSPSQDRAELKPERPFTEEIEPEQFQGSESVGDLARHHKNWLECIRTGATPNGNIDVAIRAHTILTLAEMSERMSLMLMFDGATRTIRTGEGKVVSPLTYEVSGTSSV